MTELVQVEYVGDRPEVIVRLAGRDQRVSPGGYVTATPAEAERLAEQEVNWRVPEGRAGDPRNVDELRGAARELGVTGTSNMNREQLLEALAAVGDNPIGATGDAEAIAEANRLARGRPADSPIALGVEDQTEVGVMRSSFDELDPEGQTQTGQKPEPQPQAAETAGEQGGVPGEQPPDEVPTGPDLAAMNRDALIDRALELDVDADDDDSDDDLRRKIADAEAGRG